MRRLILITLAVLVLVPAVLFGFLQTGPGKSLLARTVERLVASEALSISIGQISGFVPSDLRIDRLDIADGQGPWISIEQARLAWRPLALLAGRLSIEELSSQRVEIQRLPEPQGEPEPSDPMSWPPEIELPLEIEVDSLRLDDVIYRPAAGGQGVDAAIAGQARLGAAAAPWFIQMTADRLDVAAGLTFEARFVPQSPYPLYVSAAFQEPANGAVSELLALPERPPVSLNLVGDGPIDNWQGQAKAAADGLFDLNLNVQTQRTTEQGRFDLNATADGIVEPSFAGPIVASWQTARLTADVGMDGSVRQSELTVNADAFAASATASLPIDNGGALTARVEALAHPAWASLLGEAAWRSAVIDLSLSDFLGTPSGEASVTLDGVSAGELSLSRAEVRTGLAATGPLAQPSTSLGIDLNAQAEGLSLGQGVPPGLIGPAPQASAQASIGLDGSIDLNALAVRAAGLGVDGGGSFTGWGSQGTAAARLSVPDLSILDVAQGAIALDVETEIAGGIVAVATTLSSQSLATGTPPLDNLLGPTPTASAQLQIDGAEVTIEQLALTADHLGFQGDGALMDGFLAAGGTVTLDDLSALSDQLTGSLAADIAVSGSLSDPAVNLVATGQDIIAAGRPITSPNLAVEAELIGGDTSASARLEAQIADVPLSVQTAGSLSGSGAWALDELLASLGGLSLDGALTGSGRSANGQIAMQANDLSTLTPLAGTPIAGSLNGTVQLEGQSATASLQVESAAFDTQSLANLQTDASIADWTTGSGLVLEVTASGIEAGGLQSGRAELELQGDVSAFDTQLRAQGTLADRPLTANLAAGISNDGTAVSVDLSRLNAEWSDIPVSLQQPATIRAGGQEIAIEDLRLALSSGRVRANGIIGATHDLQVEIADVPAALAGAILDGLEPAGNLAGAVRLTGDRNAPDGRLDLTLSDLALSSAVEPADITLASRLTAERVTADAAITSAQTVRIEASGALALSPPQGGLLPTAAPDAALSGEVSGQIDLTSLGALAPAELDRLAGLLDIQASLGGALNDPQANGTIRLSNGTVESRDIGLLLTDLTSEIAIDPRRIDLRSLTGNFASRGTLSANATLDLDQQPAFPVSGQLTIDQARVLDGELATVDMQSNLALSGRLNQAARLAGTISIPRAEFRIPETLPVSVVDLPVREKGVPVVEESAEAGAANPMLETLALDIDIDAPSQVFVRGRGLDAEMGGAFAIGGTAASPQIEGELALRRGRMTVLAQTLSFDRGRIDFDGAAPDDPNLDFLAGTQVGDTLAQIAVTGSASAPTFAFLSEPSLPEDEVASLILFGERSSELSAFQAFQLASAVAELTGVTQGPSVADRVRAGLGLDELTVESNRTGPSLSAGRYVSDRVFVGVDQGLGQGGESSVSVEVEVNDNISVESQAGARSAGQVGINFRWEY
ncbi:MAG: translocation/assembly module TamB domain-containing protein [Pseudomonadota bacterium]